MKKQQREEMKEQEGKIKAFAQENLSAKNVALGVGIASLAGLATYSTVRALKNEQLLNKIRKELNFGNIKNNISSKLNEVGLFKKQEEEKADKKTGKNSTKSRKPAKPKARKKSTAKS